MHTLALAVTVIVILAMKSLLILSPPHLFPLDPEKRQLGKPPQRTPKMPASRMFHDPLQKPHHRDPNILPRVEQAQAEIEQAGIRFGDDAQELQYRIVLQLFSGLTIRIIGDGEGS